ncbi:hypothetical protein B0O80DRAFT_443393 [Mortierella sp. GBAus27b]|nr:hypothetical protein B0O80DRAFT_443393 [Mortierella sp. GBAus27b]
MLQDHRKSPSPMDSPPTDVSREQLPQYHRRLISQSPLSEEWNTRDNMMIPQSRQPMLGQATELSV